ncbi:MAG: diacylglycerol kinase catalytic region [Candidatus Saccharibacteria bacterium]|nr:diacylglycerol kinase catalytic region [Candidatus Saccharibacteria bacterium]MDB5180531.1 diacylglycerol kinase catalytic region [Candidatus Saccharibacteria bacterium]
MNYTTVAIIYNPNSTGSSKTLAEEFQKNLLKKLPNQKVELIATEYAGHAEKLAYKIAKASKKPLIFSSSGDGGYNEVVNGIMKAQNKGYKPTAGLLPAGNANDHYHNVHTKNVINLIVAGETKQIDLLRISYRSKLMKTHRYAHSYIGFGISSMVSEELNKTKLNRFKETWLVARTLFTHSPVKLKIGSEPKKYDSVIVSNVDRMSKYLTVSRPSRMDDGLFEVTISTHENKLKLIGLILRASLIKLKEDKQTDKFSFDTVDKTLAQTDGELLTINAKTHVDITIEKQVLNCLV